MRRLRIGIDVGGTFTHAVAVDNDTLELIAHEVVPTAHRHEQGVAAGIIQVFLNLKKSFAEDDKIVFLAHSTTQATNALLEGDVAKVGIIALASGLEAVKVKGDVSVGSIELSPGKFLYTECAVLDPESRDFAEALKAQIEDFKQKAAGALVAAQGFSVDDPSGERTIQKAAAESGLPSCATHEMSGLYGLSVRTETAVLNAGILPKMMNTALMTKEALDSQNVGAPLMIMRSDGGVMSLEEVKRRPVLTLLSGPAAGIAACLMFLKASDALFLEVGGTSTDICLIKDGKAAVRSASVGGHSTYLRTLDSRTLGVAGGSMAGGLSEIYVGPRSAHLAGFTYCSFAENTDNLEFTDLKIAEESPFAGDHAYFTVCVPDGRKFAFTCTCAANLLGLVPKGGYSQGNIKFIASAFAALAAYKESKGKKISSEAYQKWESSRTDKKSSFVFEGSEEFKRLLELGKALAYQILSKGAEAVIPVLKNLIADYKMEGRSLKLIGGGGGAAAVVPFAAQAIGLPFEIADHAEVISAVGAALAMVRESIEKNIMNPSPADIQELRSQAEQAVVKMGADPESIEVSVEVDAQKNLVRAVAQGSVAFSSNISAGKEVSEAERLETLSKSGIAGSSYRLLGTTGFYYIYEAVQEKKVFFGLFKKRISSLIISDRFGSIRLQLPGAEFVKGRIGTLRSDLERVMQEYTSYGDAGALIPGVHLAAGHKICDLSSLISAEQVISLAQSECASLKAEDEAFYLVNKA